ncbi:DUF2892 domain-containing protein [Candidatus Woesearchaeota archaeon]|nr:DUF2892 domain-containing protein [Candidatus Woesearchaeota archaeon]
MKNNVGVADRAIRFIGGLILLYLGLFLINNTLASILLVIFGLIGVVEGLIGYCGLYKLLGINTAKRR